MEIWRPFSLGQMTTWCLIIGHKEHYCNVGFLFLNKTFYINSYTEKSKVGWLVGWLHIKLPSLYYYEEVQLKHRTIEMWIKTQK